MLSSLLRKAAVDAGFDLVLGSHAGWQQLGVSGLNETVWIAPAEAGTLLAVESAIALGELSMEQRRELAMPDRAVGIVYCASPGQLYEALRRVRVVLEQLPPAPETRFQSRLEAITSTTADAVVRQRIGQDLFREMLMDYWGGRCAVTGLDVPDLLRASHAKPWKDASDSERLDVHNGFLLAVHLDALFDRGLVTFRDDMTIELSPFLPPTARTLFIGDRYLALSRLAEGHRPYLEYHRSFVFRT